MPTLYWGPWLAKIRRGGPAVCIKHYIKSWLRSQMKLQVVKAQF